MTAPTTQSTGLRLLTSNRLEQLAALLADVARAPLSSPFKAEVVVVQSQGMARWLEFELARRLGVCAHVCFSFPKRFAWELFRAADERLPADPDGEPETLAWRLMRLLPGHAGQPGFEPVAHYLGGDADGRKRFQLSRRLAHLFDQYLIYRPEMILRWENGVVGRGEEWQAALWRELAKELRTPHPARLRERLAQALRDGTFPTDKLPSRLSIFGISTLPPFYVELFESLAQRIPVGMFLLQPTPEYWGDIDSARSAMRALRRAGQPGALPSELHFHAGNPLLASLGNQGRDFLNVLLGATEFDAKDFSVAPDTDSLLHCLQSDIFQLHSPSGDSMDAGTDSATARRPVSPADVSVQVHSCHSPLRELEVLRDQMLSWFESDPGLAPHDLLVMMPDIESYAPFIEAVFGAVEREDRRFIPFSVADRGASASSPILGSFLALLNLAGARLGASSVLALLEAEPLRARFDIAEFELPLIRRWVDESGIRWGRDASHRAQLGLPALAGNTWREGLDRLQTCAAPTGEGETSVDLNRPADGMETRRGKTLGSFVIFAEAVFAAVRRLEEPHPLSAWVEVLSELAGTFFIENDSTETELRVLRRVLADIERQAQSAAFHEPIPLPVLLEHLAPALAEDHLHSGFITGCVTFGALRPMRSIPFEIVCLVGMNDSAFPRADTRTGFDLLARSPRLGDQSRREDDRYLFLETLLSARRRFYISHVGQSVRDNSPAPPSVLVSELLDYVEQGFALEPGAPVSDPARPGEQPFAASESGARTLHNHLIVHHRLQAFNEEYFRPAGRLFSYSVENFAACEALRAIAPAPAFVPGLLSPPADSVPNVTVEQLVSFFANPSRFFALERLKLRIPRPQSAIADREPVEIDDLESYALKTELLEHKLAGESPEQTWQHFKASGRLPLGRVGEARHLELSREIDGFLERLRPFQPEHRSEPRGVDFALGEFRITGQLPATSPAGQLLFRPATLKPKDCVRAWVTHLLWHAAAGPAAGRTVLVGAQGRDRSTIAFDAVPDAAGLLEGLLELYWRGFSEPLPFFPATSLAFVEAGTKDPIESAFEKWTSGEHHRGDDADEYFALCFPGDPPLAAEFAGIARAVIEPMLKYEKVLE